MTNTSRVDRINELAKKKKSIGLTDAEKAEQQKLYKEYLSAFRKNMEMQLDNVYIVDENGNEHKLRKK